MPHNTVAAIVTLFLRNDLKDLRSLLLKRVVLFKDKIELRGINQPPRPGNEVCKNQIINCPGHPSLKRRGNVF
jgi:hypothetical protein